MSLAGLSQTNCAIGVDICLQWSYPQNEKITSLKDKRSEKIPMQINASLHEISYISIKQHYRDQAFHNSLLVKLYAVSQPKHA